MRPPDDVAAELHAVMSAIEQDGFMVHGFLMRADLMRMLRTLRAGDADEGTHDGVPEVDPDDAKES